MANVKKWQKEFEVGIEIIDNQHKILFDLTNDLDNAVKAGTNMRVIDTLFSVINNYAFNHFETEEEFMVESDDYLRHCHKHYQMIKRLHDYMHDYHNGRTSAVDIGSFFENWLVGHIRKDDIPALSSKLNDLSLSVEIDGLDDFDSADIDSGDIDKRNFRRLRYDTVMDEEIIGHCYNTTTMVNGIVSVMDLSSGGLKLYSEKVYDVDDLLIISCPVGKNFRMKEKMRVKNTSGNFYGVEFVSPSKETVTFLTQLLGAVNHYSSY